MTSISQQLLVKSVIEDSQLFQVRSQSQTRRLKRKVFRLEEVPGVGRGRPVPGRALDVWGE